MKNSHSRRVIGIPLTSSATFSDDPSTQYHITAPTPTNHSLKFKQNKVVSVINKMNKLGERANSLALGIREHVRIGPKLIMETVKGKLSLGAKIVQLGGLAKVFEQNFGVRKGEKLLKASQCYLSTTAGPITGLLFISTNKIAFCSERSIKLSSPTGDSIRVPYKVLIPVRKIKRANECQNMIKPSQKYIEIVTEDDFEFWFMGFLNYQKTMRYLQQAISQSH